MEANKWEDTIMKEQQLQALLEAPFPLPLCYPKTEDAQLVAENQAEITWAPAFKVGEDKGKQEGIREVVEDMEQTIDISKLGFRISAMVKCLEKWQAFLKERLEE